MKIIWLSRHPPSDAQLIGLKRIFGENVEVKLVLDFKLPSNAREAVEGFDEYAEGYEVVVVVLPPHLLEAVLKFSNFAKGGGIVVRAIMINRTVEPGKDPDYEFSHFERVLEVRVVTERL